MLGVACWEFNACLEMLRAEFGRTDLEDDLDPEAERQLCERAARETGIPAVFVLGFPLAARPFYTAPRGSSGAASSFDLLFQGLEITTGGQRLHRREDLEAAAVRPAASICCSKASRSQPVGSACTAARTWRQPCAPGPLIPRILRAIWRCSIWECRPMAD